MKIYIILYIYMCVCIYIYILFTYPILLSNNITNIPLFQTGVLWIPF